MSPASARLDARNRVLANSVFGCDDTLESRVGLDGDHLFKSQLGAGAALSSVRRSMLDSIKLIVPRRIPPQIFQPVVNRIAIVVASLMTLRSWPDKRQKNEPVHFEVLRRVVFPKKDVVAFVRLGVGGLLQCLRSGISDAAQIRDFVKTFVAGDLFPVFHISDYPTNDMVKQ